MLFKNICLCVSYGTISLILFYSLLFCRTTFLGRFCLSVPELCFNIRKVVDYDIELTKPQLKRQLSRQTSRKHLHTKSKLTEHFQVIERQFTEQSKYGFNIWTKWVGNVCSVSVDRTLKSKDDYTLFATTNWEDVLIEEEGEDGQKLKSTIRVPSQVRVKRLLFSNYFKDVSDIVSSRRSLCYTELNLIFNIYK